MPVPGSHDFDIHRTRLRDRYGRDHVPSAPDRHSDIAARADLERDSPPRRLPPTERVEGPKGSTAQPGAERGGGLALHSSAVTDHTFMPERFSTENRAPGWGKDMEQGTLTTHVAADEFVANGGFVVTGPCAEDRSDPTVGELWARYVRPELLGHGIRKSLHEAGTAALATRFRDAIL